MAMRRDFANERIVRVEAQLAVARLQVLMLGPADGRRAAQLRDQLDDMLEDLLGATEADRHRNADRSNRGDLTGTAARRRDSVQDGTAKAHRTA